MRSKDRLIISAMMIVAFLIVVFLVGFIALVLIEDSIQNRTNGQGNNFQSSTPSIESERYNVYFNDNKGIVIPINHSSSNTNKIIDQSAEAAENKISKEIYDNILRNREEILEAESEMEDWCNQINSNSCLEMKYTRMHSGCKPINIECKKYNDEDVCFRYEVDIIDKFVDEEFCEN